MWTYRARRSPHGAPPSRNFACVFRPLGAIHHVHAGAPRAPAPTGCCALSRSGLHLHQSRPSACPPRRRASGPARSAVAAGAVHGLLDGRPPRGPRRPARRTARRWRGSRRTVWHQHIAGADHANMSTGFAVLAAADAAAPAAAHSVSRSVGRSRPASANSAVASSGGATRNVSRSATLHVDHECAHSGPRARPPAPPGAPRGRSADVAAAPRRPRSGRRTRPRSRSRHRG